MNGARAAPNRERMVSARKKVERDHPSSASMGVMNTLNPKMLTPVEKAPLTMVAATMIQP